MKRIFLTFCDSRYTPSIRRIKKQAKKINCFDKIIALTEKDLDKQFLKKYKNELKAGSRGFGYWIWKPYIIAKTLKEMNNGDQLLYTDTGCHINPQGRQRLLEYFSMVEESAIKIGATQIEKVHNEKKWTKMDLLTFMGVQDNELILNSGQIESGHIIIEKCTSSVNLIYQWLKISQITHLRDDSESISPNFEDFCEHRHDQSIFSILCKLNNAVKFPGNEFFPTNGETWEDLKNYPILDKRDKKKSTFHLIINKLRQLIKGTSN